MVHERAGTPATPDDLVDVPELLAAYDSIVPDVDDAGQRVVFGTSGHRGSSLDGSFNDAHIAATTQAICEYRRSQSVDGPLFLGRDTHALSEPAWETALEVLAANEVEVRVDADDRHLRHRADHHGVADRFAPRRERQVAQSQQPGLDQSGRDTDAELDPDALAPSDLGDPLAQLGGEGQRLVGTVGVDPEPGDEQVSVGGRPHALQTARGGQALRLP